MTATKHKKRRWLRVLATLCLLGLLGLIALYYFIQTPTFLRFVIRQLNRSMSGEITYDEFNLDLERGRLNAKNLAYRNRQQENIVSIARLDLDFAVKKAIKGQLEAQRLRIDGLVVDQRKSEPRQKPSSWRTALRFVLQRLSVDSASVDACQIYLRNGDEFDFKQIEFTLSPQIAQRQRLQSSVQQSELKLASLPFRSGPIRFSGEVIIPLFKDFTFFISEAEGHLDLQEVFVGSWPFQSFASSFKIGGETIYLREGRLSRPEGDLLLAVDYTPKSSRYKIDLQNEHFFPFSAIPRASARLLQTFDRFDLQLKAELQGFRLPQMQGKVALQAKAFGNRANSLTPEHRLTLAGDLRDGALVLSDFNLESAKTRLQASGSVDFDRRQFDLQATARSLDLQTLMKVLSSLDIRGYVDGEGSIRGPFNSPEFAFDVRGRELAYSFLHFGENTGVFKISAGKLSYTGQTPPQASGYAAAQIETERIFQKSRHTSLKTQFRDLETAPLLDNPEIQGKISGTFDLTDKADSPPQGRLQATLPELLAYSFRIQNIETQGTLGERRFLLHTLIFQPPQMDTLSAPDPIQFDFDDQGVRLKGRPLAGVALTGHYEYAQAKQFFVDVDAAHADLRPVWAALSMPVLESYADGKVKMAIGVKGYPSAIDIEASHLSAPFEGGELVSAEPVRLTIRPPRFNFERLRLSLGGQSFAIQGHYQFNGPLQLQASGKVDLHMLEHWPTLVREASGVADIKLSIGGTRLDPQVRGSLDFADASLAPRSLRGTLEHLNGRLLHTGDGIVFEGVRGTMADGDVAVNGSITTKRFSPQFFDLTLEAREVTLAEPDHYKLIFSGDFGLKGPAEKMLLSGELLIAEGRYTRDFSISEFILKPQEKTLPEAPNPWLEKLWLDLHIKSPGELAIKNNLAKMFFSADLKVEGKASKPEITGALQILEGKFEYFKVAFEEAQGYIDFRKSGEEPYVDISAHHEFVRNFSTVNVTAQIQGFLNNLQLNFTSDSGLPKRDLLALVFTGALPGEGPKLESSKVASSVIAGQLAGFLQKPLERHAQLDIFRLEATDPESKNLTTLVVGKQLTDRLSLEFKTDLGVDDPLQGIQMEYLMLDNALLKASQLSDGSFDFNFTLRWRSF